MKKELLAGLSALALMAGAASPALADGIDADDDFVAAAIDDDNSFDGVDASSVGNGNAIAGASLVQISANALAGDDVESSVGGHLAGDLTWRGEAMGNPQGSQTNANTAVNVAQQGAVTIAGSFNGNQ